MTATQSETKYYLVGRVPVAMTIREDGVYIRAFNPLLGGYVADARYYSAIKFGENGDVRPITEEQFKAQARELADEFGVSA